MGQILGLQSGGEEEEKGRAHPGGIAELAGTKLAPALPNIAPPPHTGGLGITPGPLSSVPGFSELPRPASGALRRAAWGWGYLCPLPPHPHSRRF